MTMTLIDKVAEIFKKPTADELIAQIAHVASAPPPELDDSTRHAIAARNTAQFAALKMFFRELKQKIKLESNVSIRIDQNDIVVIEHLSSTKDYRHAGISLVNQIDSASDFATYHAPVLIKHDNESSPYVLYNDSPSVGIEMPSGPAIFEKAIQLAQTLASNKSSDPDARAAINAWAKECMQKAGIDPAPKGYSAVLPAAAARDAMTHDLRSIHAFLADANHILSGLTPDPMQYAQITQLTSHQEVVKAKMTTSLEVIGKHVEKIDIRLQADTLAPALFRIHTKGLDEERWGACNASDAIYTLASHLIRRAIANGTSKKAHEIVALANTHITDLQPAPVKPAYAETAPH